MPNSQSEDYEQYLKLLEEVERMRNSIINSLREIQGDITEEDKRERIGKIVYSSVGIISGVFAITGLVLAPFTLGVSLGLTVGGAAVGAASGGASITHGVAKHVIVKKKCKEAERLLNAYKSKVKEFAVLVDNLLTSSQQIRPLIHKHLGQSVGVCADLANIVVSTIRLSSLRSIGPIASAVAKTTGEAATETTGVASKAVGMGAKVASTVAKGLRISGCVFAALSIVIDIGTIVNNGINLHKSKLSEQARMLSHIIDELENK